MSDERKNKSVENTAISQRTSFFKKKLEIASLFESYGKEKKNFIEREKNADCNWPYGNIPVMRHKIRGKEKYVSKHLGDLKVGERVPHRTVSYLYFKDQQEEYIIRIMGLARGLRMKLGMGLKMPALV